MRTANLGNVPVTNSGFKPSKFPMSKNFYGSCSFGEVCCAQCLETQADSDSRFNAESLAYLAAINAPTYGHVNLQFWHYFVELADLTKLWDKIMTKQSAVGYRGQLFYPKEFPSVARNLLSTLFLWGAHCTIYDVDSHLGNNRNVRRSFLPANPASASITAFRDHLQSVNSCINETLKQRFYNGFDSDDVPKGIDYVPSFFGGDSEHVAIDARVLLDMNTGRLGSHVNPANENFWIPLSNPSYSSLYEVHDSSGNAVLTEDGIDVAPVSLESADFVIERELVAAGGVLRRVIFAFRMHAFGYRLYKLLKGSGFQEDFADIEPCSLMPIFALYKAYFDTNGILLYKNWSMTACGRLLELWDNTAGVYKEFDAFFCTESDDVDADVHGFFGLWKKFILELGSCWVTSAQDYYSAHIDTTAISNDFMQSFINRIADANNNDIHVQQPFNTVSYDNDNGESHREVNEHAYIDQVIHTQLSAIVLQRLALVTNRDTIAGKRIEQLLRMKGFGKWYDQMKPRFIGSDTIPVDFSQVISQADTFNGSSGAIIGERGGRGQAYGEGKWHKYHNEREGYLITLFAVVPDAGYCQGLNVAYDLVGTDDFYKGDFDGVGHEATKRKSLVGELPICLLKEYGGSQSTLSETFGFMPQMSKFKVNFNTISGNFARRSHRTSYLTYSTDKFIGLGEINVKAGSQGNSGSSYYNTWQFTQVFPDEDLPNASEIWRYPTRYPFLGNFARIFAALGDTTNNESMTIESVAMLRNMWEYLNNEDDGFTVMATLGCSQRKRMLPITDSFQTRDSEDGNSGPISTNVSKA